VAWLTLGKCSGKNCRANGKSFLGLAVQNPQRKRIAFEISELPQSADWHGNRIADGGPLHRGA